MVDETANLTLSLLCELRSDVASGFKRVHDDVKYPVSSLEQQIAGLKSEIAHYSARQDQHDRRFERIERRLELKEPD